MDPGPIQSPSTRTSASGCFPGSCLPVLPIAPSRVCVMSRIPPSLDPGGGLLLDFRHMTSKSPTPWRPSRRRFLQTSAAAGAGLLGFPAIVSSRSPNSKLNLAFIGAGGRGAKDMAEMEPTENIVALCDVNAHNLESAHAKHPKARIYKDFRKLYDDKTDDIDAVVVATTEHTHAFATLPALQLKKPVYCEKPLTRDVFECRKVIEAAAAAGVPTQMGTQMHATDNFRRVVELVRANAVGPIREVHVWVSRSWGLQSREEAEAAKDPLLAKNGLWVMDRPKEGMPVPDFVDWDLWIGPAPWREYHDCYLPGPMWYRWWDFANGTMSDLGSHWNDLPFWALELDAPLTVEAFGPDPHPEIAPATMSAKYEYGQRGELPPVTLTWYQGNMKPPQWENGEIPQWGNGMLFIGDDGMILADYRNNILLPEEKFKDFERPPMSIESSPGQQVEFLEAIKNGTPTLCHFGYSGPLTEANHLGNVAFRAGTKLEWDSKNLKIPNAPEAERFLKREYREGWSLG